MVVTLDKLEQVRVLIRDGAGCMRQSDGINCNLESASKFPCTCKQTAQKLLALFTPETDGVKEMAETLATDPNRACFSIPGSNEIPARALPPRDQERALLDVVNVLEQYFNELLALAAPYKAEIKNMEAAMLGDAKCIAQLKAEIASPRVSAIEDIQKRILQGLDKYMVDRFLSWRLPENFNPDAGISFKKTFNEHTSHPMKHEPTGTNLFDVTQATAMVRYMLEGAPHKVLLDKLLADNVVLAETLAFYADPETYFAIAFVYDRPCGDFSDDESESDSELGIRHGKRARAALATLDPRSAAILEVVYAAKAWTKIDMAPHDCAHGEAEQAIEDALVDAVKNLNSLYGDSE